MGEFEPKTESLEKEIIPKKGKRKPRKHDYQFNLQLELLKRTGVDLTRIPGIDSGTALKIISEIGLDMNRWPTAKHFTSWLGLCPGTKISGGQILSGKTKSCANKAASALRLAANTLYRSDSALGGFLRRMKTRLGAPKAITACAHKLAITIYNMLKKGLIRFFRTHHLSNQGGFLFMQMI